MSKSEDLSISEILLTLNDGMDKFTVATMLEQQQAKKIKTASEKAYTEGYNASIARRRNWQNIWNYIENYLGWGLGIGAVIAVYIFFHLMNAHTAVLELNETTACSTGQYAQCKAGWLRQHETNGGFGSVDHDRAKSYEEMYYHSTGHFLVLDPKDREMSLTERPAPQDDPAKK